MSLPGMRRDELRDKANLRLTHLAVGHLPVEVRAVDRQASTRPVHERVHHDSMLARPVAGRERMPLVVDDRPTSQDRIAEPHIVAVYGRGAVDMVKTETLRNRGRKAALGSAIALPPHFLKTDHVGGMALELGDDRLGARHPRAVAPPDIPGKHAHRRFDEGAEFSHVGIAHGWGSRVAKGHEDTKEVVAGAHRTARSARNASGRRWVAPGGSTLPSTTMATLVSRAVGVNGGEKADRLAEQDSTNCGGQSEAGRGRARDQEGRGAQMHRQCLPTRGQSQTRTDAGFPRPAWPASNDGLAALDPFASGEIEHLGLVHRRGRLELEAVRAFDGGELRCLDAPFDEAAFAVDEFGLHQSRQELYVVQALVGALARHLNCPGCSGPRDPWRGVGPVEFSTLEQIDCFNNRRLFESIGRGLPPRPKRRTIANRNTRPWPRDSHKPVSGKSGAVQ